MKSFSSIVITGASSGIGEAMALDYAAPGVALALTGRDADRLETVTAACRAKGATIVAATIDVTDRERFLPWLEAFDDAHPVDLVIANAGISIDKDNSSLDDFSIIRKTLDVNINGVLNTVEPLLPRMIARKRGQIGIVSSLAGFIGLPYSASYNASKAAVRVWGESIRYVLKKDGVGVSVICPGFVVSRITAEAPFPMPFLMTSAKASAIIRRGLALNRPRIAFPIGTKAAVWLGTTLPGRWSARLLGAG
ncbi:SDR family NAD(P)-dependent oxidoreductase [Reyranella aquatilis]|uniref:SDR family NAD(P)-dependent oxidoreductase n=1 Tax=Reyranella aquatilis TaxID=2035356 RepID=A0ABS8L1L2_9HYPH|nr:SDR family NAD(P)-dependent oxidoreductase [Reyranella aquatilis]MCC8432232.1 SDR family NAD(P)-dependent oxidoreductase [Reyranella aquatilis]